jgi:hypothetical protein
MSQVEDDIVKDIIKTKNVLIVDDSPDILFALDRKFQGLFR